MGLDIYFQRVRRQTEDIGYFRKVNFLVAFFEDYYGQEVGNCVGLAIDKEAVQLLISNCQEVLLHHERAEELLPTRGGFFFGDTSYNEYYFEDVESVLEYAVNNLLPQFDDLDSDETIEFLIWY